MAPPPLNEAQGATERGTRRGMSRGLGAEPRVRRHAWTFWLLVALIAWPVAAVGGVYQWAGAPLLASALLLAVIARPRVAASREAAPLDVALLASAGVVLLQLVPLPQILHTWISPQASIVRTSLQLDLRNLTAGWQPLSIDPGATAYALGLVVATLLAFWACRQACNRGITRSLIGAIAAIGLLAALVALSQGSTDAPLIYGRWMAADAGARPFGPFVNRNHFATWVLMAFPLTVGYVASALSERRPAAGLAGTLASALQSLGSSTTWVAVAGAVMTLALVVSASRSGLIALGVSLVGGVWIARPRLHRRARRWGVVGLLLLVAFVTAYANFAPMWSRVEETLAVGAGGRPQIWRETWRLIQDFWLTGTGLGAYQTAMLVYQQSDRASFINQAHQQYLHLAAEGGLVLAGSATVAVVAFVRLFRARLARDTSPSAWLRVGSVTAILAVAVQGWWETGLRIPANGILFAVAAAIAVHRPPTDQSAGPGLATTSPKGPSGPRASDRGLVS